MYTAKEMQEPKAFEKLETVSVGRASHYRLPKHRPDSTSEEMKLSLTPTGMTRRSEEAVDHLKSANDIEELKEIFMGLWIVDSTL